MSKVKRFSLEERYGYQNRKVIYDKNADNDIELNNIYPIIGLLNQFDKQIADLEAKLDEKDKEIETKNIVNNLYKTTVSLRDNDFKDLVYENNSLKQQLNSQPAEIVEKIKEQLYSKARSITGTSVNCVRLYDIRQILDTILKEYQK